MVSFQRTNSFCWWRSLLVICLTLKLCDPTFGSEATVELSPQVKQSLFGSVLGITDDPASRAPVTSSGQTTGRVPGVTATNGEDIGAGDESNVLLKIELQMKTVTRNLRMLKFDAEKSTGEIQKLQFDIIRQLTRVIEREQVGPQSVLSETPTAGASGQEAGVGTTSEIGTTAAGGNADGTQDLTPQELAQRQLLLWNHLPPRVRTQLRDAAANPFIPRYERLIEQFYLRLNQQKSLGQ